MVTPPDETTADPYAVIAALRQQLAESSAARDAGLAREATLAEELAASTTALAQRNTDFDERIEYQTATIDVLEAMAASPGDPQPIFDLIVRRATELCDADGGGLALLDGGMLRLQAYVNHPNPRAYEAAFPQPVSVATMFGRAILARDAVQMANSRTDVEYGLQQAPSGSARSMVGVPLLHDGAPIGAISVVGRQLGEFSAIQVELLRTFAKQAVIAITSAETYRALQGRTSDLQEALKQQTAISEVLKAIAASPHDAQPVFELIARRAKELSGAPTVGVFEYDGALIHARMLEGYDAAALAQLPRQWPRPPGRDTAVGRAVQSGQISHIRDTNADPDFAMPELAYVRSVLGVPLLHKGQVVGAIALVRSETGGFDEAKVAMVQSFAEQAVIAITSAQTFRALQRRTSDLARAPGSPLR
jgi:GAF domain-containing protein